MLEDAKIAAVIPVRDLAKARTFYEKMLGLGPQEVHEAEGEVLYSLNDNGLLVYKTEAAQGQATKVAFMVGDLAREMADLKSHGVVFEDLDLPGVKTVDGVMERPHARVAWFKDLDGNYLAIMEEK